MSNALLSDVEARAERRRTRTRGDVLDELATEAWQASKDAADPAEALRWLERAHRMAPEDGMVATTLAGALLGCGALHRAGALFRAQAARHGALEAWAGLAVCAHLSGAAVEARAALQAALRAYAPTETLRGLAQSVAPPDGWCGLDPDGGLHASVRPRAVRMDGVALRLSWSRGAAKLPAGWRAAGRLEVDGDGGPMLGSPLPIAAFAGVEGFVAGAAGGLAGWVWCPSDPGRTPEVWVEGHRGACLLRAAGMDEAVRVSNPFVRPRRFEMTAAQAASLGEVLRVTGADGRNLLGSPLDPLIEARGPFTPVWVDRPTPPPRTGRPSRQVDVVVPVYRGVTETLACLDSVLASVGRGTRVVVVDDASPDAALAEALDALARRRRIVLVRLAANRGFPGAANAGIAAAAGRDVVLLNSDTLVPPGWLERLRGAAYSAPDIGTVTPLTNDGTIVSVPDPGGGNPAPDLAGTIAADALAQRANGDAVVDLPVGVGFCLYLRRDCLDQVGVLREDLFAQGYGEENDLCLRARQNGWRNVAAAGVFVAHVGATSFGAARAHLIGRNTAILTRLHPGYHDLVAAHVAADPLGPARRRMDGIRWARGRRREGALAMVTHGGGGGVDRVIEARAKEAEAAGRRVIVLRPGRTPSGGVAVRVEQPGGEAFPNLVYPMPSGLPALVRLLRADRVATVELHHLLGHDAGIAELAGLLGAEAVSVVHDYARFCPRIALVSTGRHYCGEPDVAGCEACIADLGSLLEDAPPVRALLARSAAELAGASRVVAPSGDAARRMARHFPGVHAAVEPWEDDAALPPPAPVAAGEVLCVAVVGAVGIEKGYEVLLGCARDARARRLPIRFVVVGFTADDARLMQAGPVSVTGEYSEAEAVSLIRAQAAQMAFIPSVWPETWCFALSRAWEAGLPAVVFELGAQAERVRATGRGWLLRLGLSPSGINDALLRLASVPVPCNVPSN